MTFCIITHVSHYKGQQKLYAYAPYVREMNIWFKHVDDILIVAPLNKVTNTAIDIAYEHDRITFKKIPSFDITTFKNLVKTVFVLPELLFTIYKAMKRADHIHLRCPGNMGLLGCIVQVFFPEKPKTAKYAGNWDPKAPQPLSYKLQRWILSNTFLTRNIQVLVYGEWENQSKNIKSFFTATYTENDKKPVCKNDVDTTIRLLFVGALSKGKRPLYSVQLAEMLFNRGYEVQLKLYGEGIERNILEHYIEKQQLHSIVKLMGNRGKEELQEAYAENHFLILPSRSEGWPKVVAEAMFWGCIPVSSPVSCVPNMLENGTRGLLLEMNLETDGKMIENLINAPGFYQEMRDQAVKWSRTYTLDYFEGEIKKLLQPCV